MHALCPPTHPSSEDAVVLFSVQYALPLYRSRLLLWKFPAANDRLGQDQRNLLMQYMPQERDQLVRAYCHTQPSASISCRLGASCTSQVEGARTIRWPSWVNDMGPVARQGVQNGPGSFTH